MIDKVVGDPSSRDKSNEEEQEMMENSPGRAYKLAEGAAQNMDVLGNSQGIRGMLYKQDASTDPFKNLRSHMFSMPKNSTAKDIKALPLLSLKEGGMSPEVLQSNLHSGTMGPGGSPFGGSYQQASGQSGFQRQELSPSMLNKTAQLPGESLGKRTELHPRADSDILYTEPFNSSKRRQGSGVIENMLSSPSHQNNFIRLNSGSESPAHSFSRGFKLHSSRKDSGVDELDDLRLSPKPGGFGSTMEGN